MGSVNHIEALERLARLHDTGKLTDMEFETQKAALLAQEHSAASSADPTAREHWREEFLREAQDIKQDLRENWGCLNPVGFSLLYLLFLIPTYTLPYRGSNSILLTSWVMDLEGSSFGQANPYFLFHATCLSIALLLAWLRGRLISKRWIIAFPITASAFDLVPGLSMIPMVPTVMHIFTLIIGSTGSARAANSNDQPDNDTFHAVFWSLALLAVLAAGYWLLGASETNGVAAERQEKNEFTDEEQVMDSIPSPEFRLERSSNFDVNVWGNPISWDSFQLTNSGDAAANIQWVRVNGRDECVVVPILIGDHVSWLAKAKDTDSVAQSVALQVGQSVRLVLPNECGRIIHVEIAAGDDRYEISS